ncbi:MAG: glucose 1-dehydrogenase [Saprospiraceae bacterium]|nr:glucose 1-dehydrogenase [Saprospiraceae bacterium]
MSFKDKSVLITGAGSGIGKATALAFAAAGAKVAVSDINEEGGRATVEEIKKGGGTAFFKRCNVANYRAVVELVHETVSQFGSLDIALNNAGIGGNRVPTSNYDISEWDQVISINQTGVFYCMREELKIMSKQGSGCIVNVSSIAGMRALPMTIAYTASKHAVIGMTKTAALEYARYGIRVNAVCPVFTETPMVEALVGEQKDLAEKLVKTIPMRRFGQVEDIVNAIFWLCDEKSSFVTGQSLAIDGGQTA